MEKALVIGASGGIGQAVVATLERRGIDVARLSRAEHGIDVTDAASVERALEALEGPFDLIFVATGVLAPPGRAPEKALTAIDATAMAQVFAVNAIGPTLVLKHAAGLVPKDAPSVVGVLTARVGSITDNRLGGWYAYRASKAAANQIVKTASVELARSRKQCVVVALHPGTVETAFTANYPGHRKVTAAEAAEDLIDVMSRLTPADTGRFLDCAGEEVPW